MRINMTCFFSSIQIWRFKQHERNIETSSMLHVERNHKSANINAKHMLNENFTFLNNKNNYYYDVLY